jgi:hypothetical protein
MSCNTNTSADLRPAQYNIKIWRNDSWMQTFALLADDTPISLTGCTIVVQVRTSADAPTAALTLSTTSGGVTIGGINNNQITLNKVVDIAAGSYVYDMNVRFPSNEVKTYLWGTFFVQEDITKP